MTLRRIGYKESLFWTYQIAGTTSEWYDKATALLLSLIDGFYSDITDGRASLDLSSVDHDFFKQRLKHGQIASWYYFTEESLPHKTRFLLERRANAILRKYHLGRRWLMPVKMLIISDVLVLPTQSPLTLSYEGVDRVEFGVTKEGEIKKRHILEGERLRLVFDATEKISRRQLVDLINSNAEELDHLFSQLPTPGKSVIKPEESSMRWGYWAWVVRTFEDPGISWQKLVDRLAELAPAKNVPDRLQIQQDYRRFVAAMNKFRP